VSAWRGVVGGRSPRLPVCCGQVGWRCRKADGGIIADRGDSFQRPVAGALHHVPVLAEAVAWLARTIELLPDCVSVHCTKFVPPLGRLGEIRDDLEAILVEA